MLSPRRGLVALIPLALYQFRDPQPSAAVVHGYMLALTVGEIGAFSVLLAGFVDGQIL
jgi:hypothetical protein